MNPSISLFKSFQKWWNTPSTDTNQLLSVEARKTPPKMRMIRKWFKRNLGNIDSYCRKWITVEASDDIVWFVYDMLTCKSKMRKGNQLEILCEHFYQSMGYETESNGACRSKTRGDGGIDIFARKKTHKVMVECKNWSKPIGVKTVRQFIGALDKCPISYKGDLVAPSGFTGGCFDELQQKYVKTKAKTITPRVRLKDMNWIIRQLMSYGIPQEN